MSGQFERRADGYRLAYPAIATSLDIDHLRRTHGDLWAEVTVSSGWPGARTVDGVMHAGNLNLSSVRARQDTGRLLASRVEHDGADELDWTGFIEELAQRVLSAEREGEPPILLRDLARPAPDEDWDIDGVRLLRRHPVILFGDGGAAKSYLGLYFASRLAENGVRVLYADWELAGEDHRDRLERITGPAMPALWYVRCERPMVAEADRLRRIVRDERIDYLIADSVAFACDGPPEAAEVAAAYFRALRQLEVGSLNIAHTTKAENGDQKPFGSTFWFNGARGVWFAKRSGEGDDEKRILIGLYNRKANLGPLARPIGYEIAFDAERTAFRCIDLVEVADLASKLTVRQRMTALLRHGALTMAEIADDLDVPVDTVIKTVKRGEGTAFARVPGPDGVYRIGLFTRLAA